MKALINESDTRHSRLRFNLAVELAMVQNLLAAEMDLNADTMQALRESCIKSCGKSMASCTWRMPSGGRQIKGF